VGKVKFGFLRPREPRQIDEVNPPAIDVRDGPLDNSVRRVRLSRNLSDVVSGAGSRSAEYCTHDPAPAERNKPQQKLIKEPMTGDPTARLHAHRAAFAALAMVLNEFAPGAFEAVIEALATFEAGARQQNEPTAMIDELRNIRIGLEAMQKSLPLGRPEPPADSDRS
jgi:hypothetical protein